MKIKYVNYGIANRFADHIEINQGIKKYKNLHKFIINHELGHTDKGFNLKEFAYEFKLPSGKASTEMLSFIIKNPEAFFLELMPIRILRNKRIIIIYDPNLLVFYGIVIIIAGVIYYAV